MSSTSGNATYTISYTGVDSSTGQVISFPGPITAFMVIVRGGATATFTGTMAGSTAAQFSGALSWPVGGNTPNKPLGTLKSTAGTIDADVFAWR